MEQVWKSHYPENIQTEVEIPNVPLTDILEQSAKQFPNNPALSFYGNETSYQELTLQTAAFASSLQNEGVKKGDRVAVMLPNCPHYVISYYGTLKAGAVVTQVNPMLVDRELEHILSDSGAETIVIYAPLLPVLEKIKSNTSIKNVVVVQFDGDYEQAKDETEFTAFLKKSPGPPASVSIDPSEDLAVLQYTGGTTGRSKGAMLTHRNVVANVVQTNEYFKDEVNMGKERYLTVIPLFHVFGMTSCMNLSIYTASKNIMLPRFELEEVLETIKKEQPTFFPGVPTMYVAITNHPRAEEYGIDSIRVCNSGSAPMPQELMRNFEAKTGARVFEGYGLSESSPVTHCNPLFAERKPGSVGIGVPSTDYKIVDVESGTEEMPVGETGEVILKGPQVMKGYWNMPEETENTLRDGWLYTGDIARVDDEGYLYIIDRKKDLIIAGGFNIYPRDVEEVIYEHEAVQEAVVVGVPDAYRGETVRAVIVLKEGKSATEEELIAYCRQNMAAYKVPRELEFRNELPKTNVGKILRRSIREEATKKA
ncbi:long-chain-fatty-acid--CoA ligase [Halobacillus amylolyticus]|uniref:Long-chain fatty acid--CoA ligase n=1 Tax=Halobacillus amylolyticus TaxID=2932259 RepID=A0ABY4H5V8_9BACI|nr:long-chain fatty acid--CoA ligase [Halobacillus amylolyticus]UOR10239.1 long-chain fatty acid--CoA ligase [Halobacillus amylolyticus]